MPFDFKSSSPESLGISSRSLVALMNDLDKIDSLNSIMILRHGLKCFEAWWTPFAPEIPHILFSLSKSFTSTAVGFARSEGRLRLDDPVASFFPEYRRDICDVRMTRATLRDLLTMRSGHRECQVRPCLLAAPDGDWVRAYLASRLEWNPGERFVYNSAASYMLAAVIRRVTGKNVREYLLPRLFDPLQMDPGPWECCPHGINCGGWGFYLKTGDIAAFAQLLLQKGRWNGMQLLPWEYFAEATCRQADNSMNDQPDWRCGYGYHFWVSRHGYRGDGVSGQYAVVLPEEDMAVAITAGCENMQRILDALWTNLLPGLSGKPLPEDPGAAAELAAISKNLRIPLAAGDLKRRGRPVIFHFKPNFAGLQTVRVEFLTDRVSLEFDFGARRETLSAGFGFNCENRLLLTDIMPRRSLASAAWINDLVLEIHVCCNETSFRDVYHLDFGSADRPFYRTSRFGTFRTPFPELEPVLSSGDAGL